jgi:signal recognition particle subunit SRP54
MVRSMAAFSFCYALKKPILFVGSGEKIVDLERFYPDRMAQRILGMGDIISLAEKAEQSLKKAEQESLTKSLQKGQLTLLDFAQQLEMMSQLGSFSQLLKYMPGMGAAALSPEAIEKAEVDLKKFRAIIGSMTRKERLLPAILDNSRKNRIAKGAGVAPGDIQLLISRFEQSKQYVKLLKFGKTSGLFR